MGSLKRKSNKKESLPMFEPVESTEDMVPRLTESEYWKWRNSISLMWLAEQKSKNADLEFKLMQKEAEILQTKMQLFNVASVKVRKSEAGEAKSEYFKLKEQLEKRLGITLDNKVIDDVTFEVKPLDEVQESAT